MPRKNLTYFLFLLSFFSGQSIAGTLADCRSAAGRVIECNPYTDKIIRAKEIRHDKNRKKLIVDKTLPLPNKKEKMRIISVEDMIEKYIKVEEPLRYKGSQQISIAPVKPTKKTKSPLKPTEKKSITKTPSATQAERVEKEYGVYKVEKGDALRRIAHRFNVPTTELMRLNHLDESSIIKIGQNLKLPMSQEKVEILRNGEYTVQPGDTLIGIAKKFGFNLKEISKFNHITANTIIRAGKIIKLPFPYIVKQAEVAAKKAAEKKKRLEAKRQRVEMLRLFGKHKLRVTATAYTSHRGQTDSTPFIAAWNNKLRSGMKIIAVSRDLLTRYGLRNGTRVKIGGLRGFYTVRDKMNKRFKKRIDIYMGTNRRRALRWGRRSVTISW